MTGKEILMKAIGFESTPRLPVGVLDGYAWILQQAGKSFQDLFEMQGGAELAAEQYRRLRSDIAYSNGHVFNIVHRIMGGEVDFTCVGESVDITKHPLGEIGDYKNFNAANVMEQAFSTPEYRTSMEQSRRLSELLRDEKLLSTVGYAPFSVAGMLVGVQDFMMTLSEDEDETLGLIEFATDLVIRNAEKFLENGSEVVFIADPIASGDLISPAAYEQYALPSLKKVCKYFNGRGTPVFFHICGHTEKRLEPMRESGIKAFSVDSIDLGNALDIARGNYAILGNFSPFDVLMAKTADEVRDICDTHAKIAGKDGGYALFPGCDLAPGTPFENIMAMADAAHNAFL